MFIGKTGDNSQKSVTMEAKAKTTKRRRITILRKVTAPNRITMSDLNIVANKTAGIMLTEFKKTLEAVAEVSSMNTLVKTGIYNDNITQRRAFALYGEGKIKKLYNENKIHRKPTGEGNYKVMYSRIEIETALITESQKSKKS